LSRNAMWLWGFQARNLPAGGVPPARGGVPHVDDGATVHVDTINTDVHAAEATLDAALAEHQALPARLPLAEVNPGQQVLDTETKLIHHAIRIAAFNTVLSLARAIVTGTDIRCSFSNPVSHRDLLFSRESPRVVHCGI
jgi:hypothetical protein